MPTTVIYCDPIDDTLTSISSVSYSAAANGSGSLSSDGGGSLSLVTGQEFIGGEYRCYESFLQFDTSLIADGDCSLTLAMDTDVTDTDFNFEVRSFDFGASITTADWRTPAQIAALTLAGSGSTAGWTSGTKNFVVSFSPNATTKYLCVSDRQRSGTAPSGEEVLLYKSSDVSGTTDDPKLTITPPAVSLSSPFGIFDGEIVREALFDTAGFA